MGSPPDRRCTKCKGLKPREHGFLLPSTLYQGIKAFHGSIPVCFFMSSLIMSQPKCYTQQHWTTLKSPIHASSSPMLTLPIAWHSVDDIFGMPAQFSFPSPEISSQSPSGCNGISPQIRSSWPRAHGQTMLRTGAIRSPWVGTRIRTRSCQSPAQAVAMGEHQSWSKAGLQTEKKTTNFRAKAKNMRETERNRQRGPLIFSFLRKTILSLDSKRSP